MSQTEFDYNHVYNDVIRHYQGDLYLSKGDGIYLLEDGQGEGELLFANPYELRRGMEVDGKYLYFCGSVQRGEDTEATVYRMDLDTHDVTDALAAYSMNSSDFIGVSVYEGSLYVSVGYAAKRIGFELDGNGEAVRMLDDQAQDFLYREYNDYREGEIAWLNTVADSEEYEKLAEE